MFGVSETQIRNKNSSANIIYALDIFIDDQTMTLLFFFYKIFIF